MVNYKRIVLSSLDDKTIDKIYNDLLVNKWQFAILEINVKETVLTKEKSIFEITNEKEFLDCANKDIYYKTIFTNKQVSIDMQDLSLYYKYIDKYRNCLERKIYGGKYYFGSIAVKTSNGFITTVRGKENLNDYTLVLNVNHNLHEVEVLNKKATINAPLLHYLFQNNKDIKVIVHLNGNFDNSLQCLDYAFPGTERDSIREINKSFNIRYHGVFYLIDKNDKFI